MYKVFNKSKNLPYRKALRSDMTEQEVILWTYLKGKRWGVKFRRQHGIGPYIADFYCKEKNLVIELDGSQHLDDVEYDRKRDEYFKSLGLRVLRFWNNEVRTNLDGVITMILSYL